MILTLDSIVRRPLGAGLVATAVLAAGCAGSAASGPDGETSADGATTSTTEYVSPINDFLGVDYSFDEDDQQQYIDQANQVEQKIAECMRAEGFQYTPVDQGQYMSFESTAADGLEWGTREWTEKYGFGNSTQRYSQENVGPDLVGYDDSMMEVYSEDDDPNKANNDYVQTLSESEQQAYYTALYGNEPQLAEDATDEEWNAAYENWEPDGCQSTAWEDGGYGSESEQAFYEEFSDELDDLYQRIDADPRIAEIEAAAEECVVAAGQPWLPEEDQWQYFEEKMSGIGYDWSTGGDPLTDAGLDPETMTEDELNDFYQNLDKLDDADRAQLAEVQAEEIAMALVYLDCNAGWQGQQEVYNEIRIDLEQQFLDENADRLAAFAGSGD